MAPNSERHDSAGESGLRIYWVGSAIVMCLGLVYVGWVFFSRWQTNREIEERIAAERRAQAAAAFEGMGGDRFEILSFYASPGVIHRGEESTLCYGVSNARKVTLEPQSNPVWPSQGRCVNVAPSKTTTYNLTATDAAGHTTSATAVVEVR